ncbi:MAG: ATP-dependent zinc metalloprotease FtsH [Candidatus Nealsonbacteria bacterium]|nr:ATP-dependent zinc metalloprotease FtsH [Candidatus Nealsonbacteria bacterium]
MKEKKFNWRWLFVVLGVGFLLYLLLNQQGRSSQLAEISYNDFLVKLDQSELISSVVIQENAGKTSGTIMGIQMKDGGQYKANFPIYLYPELPIRLEKAGVKTDVRPVQSFSWTSILWLVLPLALLVWLMFSMRKAGQQQMDKVISMGRTKTQLAGPLVKERFSDVAGIDEVKEEVEDIVDFLRNPKKYEEIGARIPQGVLLVGPPGTGKTLLAKAIAGEAGVPFFSISGSEFVEMFVGVGAARVRDLFEKAKVHAPSIIFIDEIDAVGRHRGAGLGTSHDEREQTLNQIFVEMDGFDERTNVIVIAATNRADILDPALLRPKRFDRKVVVNKPDVKGREEILKVHTKGKPLAQDVNLAGIAKLIPGVSGADLENLVNEAAIAAVKQNKSDIDGPCFNAAMDKILMGKGRKLVMDGNDKKIIVHHETGHVFLAKSLPGMDPVRKVSIIARERSLGQTLCLPENDRYIISETYLRNLAAIFFGGRAAEEIFLQEKSSGAEDDLRKATEIVQKMVCSYGMSKLGPRVFGAKEEEVFLGREVNRKEDVSPETLREIDGEVKRIVELEYGRAKEIISKDQEAFKKFVEALLEKETLGQDEIDEIWDRIHAPKS